MAEREYPGAPRLGAGALVMKGKTVLLVKRGTSGTAGFFGDEEASRTVLFRLLLKTASYSRYTFSPGRMVNPLC